MTSTSFNIGLNNETRNSSKVLRPPGGGTSDIFGGSTPSTPRSVRNNMASNIFGPTDVKNGNESAPRRPGIDSHSRLFGDVERVPPTPKSYHKTNIPIGTDDADAAAPKVTNGNGTTTNGNGSVASNGNGNGVHHENGHANGNANGKVNGTNGHTNGHRDGNPITGEGYNRGAAQINTTVPALNGANQAIMKNRIPPGGFSSGLW